MAQALRALGCANRAARQSLQPLRHERGDHQPLEYQALTPACSRTAV